MRLLVLDDSPLLEWTVVRLCPPGTELLIARSFEEACRLVVEAAPDAAVVSVPPADLPWSELQRLCVTRRPPVPVLYLSCLYGSTAEAGLGNGTGQELLRKPAGRADFEAALGRLLEAARSARGPGVPGEIPR